MKNFEFETISADLGKADLMTFSETSNLNEMYKGFHQKLLDTQGFIQAILMSIMQHKKLNLTNEF